MYRIPHIFRQIFFCDGLKFADFYLSSSLSGFGCRVNKQYTSIHHTCKHGKTGRSSVSTNHIANTTPCHLVTSFSPIAEISRPVDGWELFKDASPGFSEGVISDLSRLALASRPASQNSSVCDPPSLPFVYCRQVDRTLYPYPDTSEKPIIRRSATTSNWTSPV